MRVAVVGSRGMPGVPGGIERHLEELYPRLAALGVEVTVYARKEYVADDCTVDGVRVIALPSYGGRSGEALTHTARALVHAARGDFDLVHVHAMGPAVLIPLAKLLGLHPAVFTFHSFDYRRSKWGPGARAFLHFCEVVGVLTADAIIAVSQEGSDHIRDAYHRSVAHIPNGPGALTRRAPGRLLAKLGLSEKRYILSVGRLSPEKCLEDVVASAAATLPDVPLVLVGDTNFTDAYVERIHALAGRQVVFPGYLAGEDLEELYSSALAYVIASEIEGLSLSLLEAMSLGCAVVASDIPGNREALGSPPAGLTFTVHDRAALGAALHRLATDDAAREAYGRAAEARVRAAYDWNAIAAATLRVYERALAMPAARPHCRGLTRSG